MFNKLISNFIEAIMWFIVGVGAFISIVAILIGVGTWFGAWGLVGLVVLIVAGGHAWAKTMEEMEEEQNGVVNSNTRSIRNHIIYMLWNHRLGCIR